MKKVGITAGTAKVHKAVLLGTARILRKFRAAGCGAISTVISSIILRRVSSIIIIIIIIMMMMMMMIIIIIITTKTTTTIIIVMNCPFQPGDFPTGFTTGIDKCLHN